MQSELFQQPAKILSVWELNRSIRSCLATRIGAVWVQGEISNYRPQASGHHYFTLKDSRSQIACVLFRDNFRRGTPPLKEGAEVQVFGEVSMYEMRGQLQLVVQIVQARGVGLLQAKFEALKQKLDAEGLFDPARKKTLPRFPRRIAIVTSPSGAAIRDMLNVLRRRAPSLHVLISPVRVQGSGAAMEIATAVRELARPNEAWPMPDLIVLTRGGGSIEDLWEFNEEILARAISDSPVPVVSAVGHEIDFTIADFVADLRAPTPSAAAELIVADATELSRRVDELRNCVDRTLRTFVNHSRTRLATFSAKTLGRELSQRMRDSRQRVDNARAEMMRTQAQMIADRRQRLAGKLDALQKHHPARELAARRDRIAELARRLAACPPHLVQNRRDRLEHIRAMLAALTPEATLRRGYSITRDANGRVLRSAAEVRDGMRVRTQLADGSFDSDAVP